MQKPAVQNDLVVLGALKLVQAVAIDPRIHAREETQGGERLYFVTEIPRPHVT
jgi:hypothetical protein